MNASPARPAEELGLRPTHRRRNNLAHLFRGQFVLALVFALLAVRTELGVFAALVSLSTFWLIWSFHARQTGPVDPDVRLSVMFRSLWLSVLAVLVLCPWPGLYWLWLWDNLQRPSVLQLDIFQMTVTSLSIVFALSLPYGLARILDGYFFTDEQTLGFQGEPLASQLMPWYRSRHPLDRSAASLAPVRAPHIANSPQGTS